MDHTALRADQPPGGHPGAVGSHPPPRAALGGGGHRHRGGHQAHPRTVRRLPGPARAGAARAGPQKGAVEPVAAAGRRRGSGLPGYRAAGRAAPPARLPALLERSRAAARPGGTGGTHRQPVAERGGSAAAAAHRGPGRAVAGPGPPRHRARPGSGRGRGPRGAPRPAERGRLVRRGLCRHHAADQPDLLVAPLGVVSAADAPAGRGGAAAPQSALVGRSAAGGPGVLVLRAVVGPPGPGRAAPSRTPPERRRDTAVGLLPARGGGVPRRHGRGGAAGAVRRGVRPPAGRRGGGAATAGDAGAPGAGLRPSRRSRSASACSAPPAGGRRSARRPTRGRSRSGRPL